MWGSGLAPVSKQNGRILLAAFDILDANEPESTAGGKQGLPKHCKCQQTVFLLGYETLK